MSDTAILHYVALRLIRMHSHIKVQYYGIYCPQTNVINDFKMFIHMTKSWLKENQKYVHL